MDIAAYLSLYPLANSRMLGKIRHAPVPNGYFSALSAALSNAVIARRCIFSHLGTVEIPDMIPEVADLLLRHEDSEWVLTSGIYRGRLLLSLRTGDPEGDAGAVAKRLAGRRGSGGGHQMMAGGQISLVSPGNPGASAAAVEQLKQRFLRFVGARDSQAESLVSADLTAARDGDEPG
jgi:nanoRNase/pAp phosphatase (c-di-AMP/oligoRNAs hydrolase)